MAKRSAHVENCIMCCQLAAQQYNEAADDYHERYSDSLNAFYLEFEREARRVAKAYEHCIEMLSNPHYFDREPLSRGA